MILTMRSRSYALHAFSISLALSLTACGAKTGLPVPDASLGDASVEVPDVPCIEVAFEAEPVNLDLRTEAAVGRADVAFLIDTTASMGDEIARVRGQLRDRIVPAIRSEIPDSRLAVATFADYPIGVFGTAGVDMPFRLMLPATEDVNQVQAAMNSIRLGDGRDEPESQVEALYQLVTGAGIEGLVDPSAGCPAGGVGFACFRRDAFPVVLLFTDAPFHNGPRGSDAYTFDTPVTHTYEEAVAELNALGARVISFDSSARGDEASDQMAQISRDTQAVDENGDALVFSIGIRGDGLGVGVVDAIRRFAGSAVFDVDTVLLDVDRGDSVDASSLVDSVLPGRAIPEGGVEGRDESRGAFLGVRAGTLLEFRVVLRNDVIAPGAVPRRYRIEVVFRADARNRIGSQIIEVVVPSIDGLGCGDAQRPSTAS